MSRFTTFGLTILLAFAPAALAVDGTVLINQSTITNGLTGCPTGGHFPIVICQSGSYRLSGNLMVPDANTDVIRITANDVAIDLNGFSILGPGTKGTGIGINSVADNTSASNGTIRGMGSNGIGISGGRVYRIQAIANGGAGIVASGDSLVSECISRGNAASGLTVGGTTMNNIIEGNLGDGIVGSGAITGNVVRSNGNNGIFANGIFVSGAALISGNVVEFNHTGILANCPANIIGNQVDSNSNNIASDIFTQGVGCLLVNNVAQ